MNITQIKCPSCGADLGPAGNARYLKCAYCGTNVAVERQNQHELDAEEAAEKVRSLIGPVKKLKTLEEKKVLLNSALVKAEKLQKEKQSERKYPYIIAPLIMVIAMLLIIDSGSFLTGLLIDALLFAGSLSFYFIGIRKTCEAYEKAATKTEECQRDIENNTKEIQETRNSADFSIVPSKYLNEEALQYIYGHLESKRAFSISHAISLYEHDKEREDLIDIQRQQIRIQNETLNELRNKNSAESERSTSKKIASGINSSVGAGEIIGAAVVIGKIARDIMKETKK